VTGVLVAAALIALPVAFFVAWPLIRHRGAPVLLPLPPDPREPLLERKSAALRALRELAFEHDAGHVSDDDYADLRARYESETAAVLSELDRIGDVPSPRSPRAAPVSPQPAGAWRHPLALAVAGVALVVFGVALGVGIVRYSEPDRGGGGAMTATAPPPMMPGGAPTGSPAEGGRTIPPEVLQGMLQAARQSLFAGRPQEASAAYQAVLKRDPQNVDALTHLGLLLVMSADGAQRGELVDHGLRLFDRALTLDPNYAPALFYRGQVLYDLKQDAAGAIAAWEKFVAIAPPGEDRERVAKRIAEARAAKRVP
jgi:tetratricopeptide (TPR) repeat protein